MPTNTDSLLQNANRVTLRFALYFSLDDEHRHADAPGFLSLITDLSLVEAAKEILPIVGHHLVERATDFVLDHAVAGATALKFKLLSALRADKASRNLDIAPPAQASDETARLVEPLTARPTPRPRARSRPVKSRSGLWCGPNSEHLRQRPANTRSRSREK
jgi:hypothetical protein